MRRTIRIGTWICRATIYDLPFLSEQAKRNILGGNAQRVFNLPPTLSDVKQERRAARAS